MSNDTLVMNKAFRTILLGIEDVIGNHGMAALLQQANLPQYISNYPPSTTECNGHKLYYIGKLNQALFSIYGARGSRAILQRVGRGQAKAGLEENATVAHAAKLALKLMPRRRQVKFVLDTAAKAVNEQMDSQVSVTEDGDIFYYTVVNCGHCIDWAYSSPVCYVPTGFVHGLLAWGLESDDISVQEIECRAKGDAACKYKVTVS